MKKDILLIVLMTMSVFGWEINTHRAIDRLAIEKSDNLKTFVNKRGEIK